ALMILFGATLFGLRMASDKLIPGNVRVHRYLDLGGGALCGLFTGLILVGTSLIAVQMMPIGGAIFGFDRYNVASDGRPERSNLGMMFKPDAFVTGMLEMFSNGRFGGDNPFAAAKPGFIDELYSRRCGTQTTARHVLPADSVFVESCWDTRSIDHATHTALGGGGMQRTFTTSDPGDFHKFLVCRVMVRDSANHKDMPGIRFRVPQFRIVGPRPSATSDPQVYLAAGMSDLYINQPLDLNTVAPDQYGRLVRFSSQTNFVLDINVSKVVRFEREEGSVYKIDVAFEVPTDFKPWYVEFKRGARFEFPRDEKDGFYRSERPDDAAHAQGGAGGPALSGGRRVGKAPGGRTHIANAIEDGTGYSTKLPIALDGSVPSLARFVNAKRKFRGTPQSTLVVDTPTGEIAAGSKIEEFFVPEGKRLFQVGTQRNKPGSVIGRALNFASNVIGQIKVIDSNGKEYYAIGIYAEAPKYGKRIFEIQYHPDAIELMPERCLVTHREITRRHFATLKPEEYSYGYLFLVDPGVTITAFHNAGKTQSLNFPPEE
ncbi:MAG: hypothetical protein O7B26_10645, partial [Planctomycetota bacterium]|nr:hypothetical protein [Planctomycetota bacterium]